MTLRLGSGHRVSKKSRFPACFPFYPMGSGCLDSDSHASTQEDRWIRGPFDLILTSLLETLDFKELDFSTFTPKTRSFLPLEARTEKLPSALTLHYENFHTCRKVEKIMQSNPFPLHLDLRARFLSLYLLISFFLIHFKVSCKCQYTLPLNT